MKERIAVITGIRTPLCKAGGKFKDMEADDLGAFVVKELMALTDISPDQIDELIFGNVLQPPHATNIARVLAVKGGLPVKMPALKYLDCDGCLLLRRSEDFDPKKYWSYIVKKSL